MCTIYGILLHFAMFCCKISFFASYAVLSRNLFLYDLRAFAWRKIEPKIGYVEKKYKYQVWWIVKLLRICIFTIQ